MIELSDYVNRKILAFTIILQFVFQVDENHEKKQHVLAWGFTLPCWIDLKFSEKVVIMPRYPILARAIRGFM